MITYYNIKPRALQRISVFVLAFLKEGVVLESDVAALERSPGPEQRRRIFVCRTVVKSHKL
jgi:hypothetical protein